MQKKTFILGIESSCDETSVAIVTRNNVDGKPLILANIIKNQIDVHKTYGGVVPELAARAHSEIIDLLIEKALKKAKLKLKDILILSSSVLFLPTSCSRWDSHIYNIPSSGIILYELLKYKLPLFFGTLT